MLIIIIEMITIHSFNFAIFSGNYICILRNIQYTIDIFTLDLRRKNYHSIYSEEGKFL